jgi:septal ring factor EnvC (AmiA/AmiB activator)
MRVMDLKIELGVLLTLIGLLCTVFGLGVGFFTFTRNRDKDVKNEASRSAVIETKLDNINRGVESIRIDIKANELKVNELSERVIRVEESSKQAHKRIDFIEKGDVKNG